MFASRHVWCYVCIKVYTPEIWKLRKYRNSGIIYVCMYVGKHAHSLRIFVRMHEDVHILLSTKPTGCLAFVWNELLSLVRNMNSNKTCTFQTPQNQDNAELFVNCLEAMVETCLPGDDLDVQNPYPSSLGIASNLNLSSSMSSLSMGSLHSPTGGFI